MKTSWIVVFGAIMVAAIIWFANCVPFQPLPLWLVPKLGIFVALAVVVGILLERRRNCQ